jgi:hypothetical protein
LAAARTLASMLWYCGTASACRSLILVVRLNSLGKSPYRNTQIEREREGKHKGSDAHVECVCLSLCLSLCLYPHICLCV